MDLIEAAMDGDTDEVQAALRAGADVTFRDPGGQTALHWAAIGGDIDKVRILIGDYDAPVDAANDGGQTPLMGAAMR